jgi:xanthine/uracil/vitamin C permease (AzgA family)
VLFFLISIFRIREYIINSIPKNLKLAISAGVGLFLGIIALEEAKIVVAIRRRWLRSVTSSSGRRSSASPASS